MTEQKIRTMINLHFYPQRPPHEETEWCSVIGCQPLCNSEAKAELDKANMETLAARDKSVPLGSSWVWPEAEKES